MRRGLTMAALLASSLTIASAEALRVAFITDPMQGSHAPALQRVLTTGAAAEVRVLSGPSLDGLDGAEVAVVSGWGAGFNSDSVKRLRAFVEAKRGVVVLRTTASGDEWSQFARDILGATPKAVFANGAAMQVIDIFPHPITAGVTACETDQPMLQFADVAADIDVLMEGIVGEEVTPMAWVRRVAGARIVYLPAMEGTTLKLDAAQRLVAQAVLWAGRREIPAAVTIVQRTFMPDAIPGAFAITLPQGPSVCFDPARGGVNYAWDGDFVDLHPRWVTKRGEPARLSGALFYRERDKQPWRDATGGPADFQFLGYRWNQRWVELRYTVAGREVRETLQPLADGTGVARHFTVDRGAPFQLVLGESERGDAVAVRGAEMRGDRVLFGGGEAGSFTIELRTSPGGDR